MLVFLDEPKNIKIVRTSPEEGTRAPLGKISKATGEIPADLRDKLQGEELSEVEKVLLLVRRGDNAKTQAEIAEFPAVCRRMYEYYEQSADPIEQRWILGALLEFLRRVRRLERQDAGGPG